MTINIPNDYEQILKHAVDSGAFATPEAALIHALNLFAADQSKQDRWDKRNQLAIEQSEQGLSKPLDEQAVVDRLQARLADQETHH